MKSKTAAFPRTAVVMNMFYTGLGVARSLGEENISVIGLTAQRLVFGNFTRYAKVLLCPDSRSEPEALLAFLLNLSEGLDAPAIIFPTRDDDLVFLDCFREKLTHHFIPVLPESSVLKACLNKWDTHLCAQRAGVPAPRSWLIEGESDLERIDHGLPYPCVLKPLAAHHWRQRDNWELVGGRKAICISSNEELRAEYASIARADKRALLQEMVPGGDESLVVTACYLDKQSNWVAGFNIRKLVQVPEGFGTGCIVQAAVCPELMERTDRLLRTMRFTGIAEVEYKWDPAKREYLLIEINPRPWDQHRLGKSCGVDLVHIAYREHAGLAMPAARLRKSERKWIAEDTFITTVLRLLWRRDSKFNFLFRHARGKRMYAIWSANDPLPSMAHITLRFVPMLLSSVAQFIWSARKRRTRSKTLAEKKSALYESQLEEGKSHG